MKRIAVEEAFITPEILAAMKRKLESGSAELGFRLLAESILFGTSQGAQLMQQRLLDIGEGRIAQMDATGTDVQVISLTSPGIQVLDAAEATELAAHSNDVLAQATRRFPGRLYGLTAVAPQEPVRAADEIERGAAKLDMRGLIINSHTFGQYLDEEQFTPILEAAQAHGQPIYLHPRDPSPQMIGPMATYGLFSAIWGFAVETGLHTMRLIFSGTFDKFPNLKFLLGHMGEALPFWLQRIDNRYLVMSKAGALKPLKRLPSEYFKDNFVITTSGVTSMPALELSMKVLGAERILYAADYPYESVEEAVAFVDSIQDADARAAIGYRNAERLFRL